jgi:glycosyltransferase involved in cell wall biosynthesis
VILYLTYNDQPSGVYWSQVTDVVDHLNTLDQGRVHLVALVSLRGYSRSRRLIREHCSGATVLPMVPRAHNWRVNWIWVYLACLWFKPSGIVARGIFATALAIRLREAGRVSQVCFDARAAYGAEWAEFRVVDNDKLIAESAELEDEVVHLADVRLSVSNALVEHWRSRFRYTGERHLVIPCTLGRSAESNELVGGIEVRSMFGWGVDDLVLVYSGTVVGWQSLMLVYDTLLPWLGASATNRILFLSEDHPCIGDLSTKFPQQVARRWVRHREVRAMLLDCDHGLLLRDPCVTNQVASPTKFAEYLSAGLPVLISENVGDLSALVEQEGLGLVVMPGRTLDLQRPDKARREYLKGCAAKGFTKEAFDREYRTILKHLAPASTEWSRPDGLADALPLVSIIVPSYNKRTYIGDMVASVQAQTDGRWELILVDDASTDGSPDLLNSFAAADPRIKVTALRTNVGANHCRNLGIAQSLGRYIIFLDADDLLAPHCVHDRLAVMKGSGLDLAVFTMEVFSNSPGDNGQRWVPDSHRPLEDFFRHKLPWQTMQPIWDREFLRGLGGFDEAFTRHQDVELHTRALLHAGVRYRLFPGTPDCWYRIAEERKVIDPEPLLERFSRSAVMYREKFLDAAERKGCPDLLLGIILRTYLQVLLHAKDGRIGVATLRRLEEQLLAASWTSGLPPPKRFLLRLTRHYNLLPFRIPGINLLLFQLLTRG